MAGACIAKGHWITHETGDAYVCFDCTVAGQLKEKEPGKFGYDTKNVVPLDSWTGHAHELVWHGWDGTDNYYVCSKCNVQSHDHAGYAGARRTTDGIIAPNP